MDFVFEIAWLLLLYYAFSITVFRLTIWQPDSDWRLTSWFLTAYVPMFIVYCPYIVIGLLLHPEDNDGHDPYENS